MKNIKIIIGATIFLLSQGVYVYAQQKSEEPDRQYSKEIKNIIQDNRVKQAFDFIKDFDNQTIDNQIKLSEIEAPPFKEHKFGKPELFKNLLNEYGADSVWIDPIGNVIGLVRGTTRKKVLAVAGHIDTVFPEGTDVSVTHKGDTIAGPGITDDNRGLTNVLTLLKTITEVGLQTEDDILFIGNMGEEGPGDLRGMKELFGTNGPQIDAFISIDGVDINRITNGGLGSHRYKITFNGPGGHSWGAFGLANPAHAMGQAIAEFVQKADEYTSNGSKTSYNVGLVDGGTSVNSIPFSVSMTIDMRALDPKRLEGIDKILHEAVQLGVDEQNKIRRMGKPVEVEFKMIGDRPSGYTAPEIDLVQRAIAANKYLGANAILGTGSTDSNIPISKGIPAITLDGGGEAGGAHSLHEWYLNKEGYKGIQRNLLVILAQAGLSGN